MGCNQNAGLSRLPGHLLATSVLSRGTVPPQSTDFGLWEITRMGTRGEMPNVLSWTKNTKTKDMFTLLRITTLPTMERI